VKERSENKLSRRLVDIGAGFGEFFIKKAKASPSKNFIIIEPFGVPDEKLPDNLTWIRAKLSDKNFLPLQDASVDEVNLNFSLSAIYADYQGSDQEFAKYLGKLLEETLRVLENDGQLIIREERGFCKKILEPGLKALGVGFEESPADVDSLSQTGQEALMDYYSDPDKNYHLQPLEIIIKGKKNK